jgi:hypothetical protein
MEMETVGRVRRWRGRALLAGALLALAAPWAIAPAASSGLAHRKPTPPARAARPPDVLVCAFSPGQDAEDMIVHPIGGIYEGRWRTGAFWRHHLPKGVPLPVYSLYLGPVGTIRLARLSGYSPPPEFSGFAGVWRPSSAAVAEELARRSSWTDQGHVLGTRNIVTAWRRGAAAVTWLKVRVLDSSDAHYTALARRVAIARGLPKEAARNRLSPEAVNSVKIGQLLAADLDGDAQDELLISAYCDRSAVSDWNLGSDQTYLFVAKKRVGGGEATTVLNQGVADDTEGVLGCLDIDGDGKAEIVTQYRSGNPDAFRIYQWSPPRVVADYQFLYGE